MRRALLCLILLAAACTNDASPKPTASATPQPNSVVVAVPQGLKGVSLYRIGEDRRATLVRTIPPPEGADNTFGFALTGADDPDLCVIWSRASAGPGDPTGVDLRCYPPGDAEGASVEGFPHTPDAELALTADGRQLAWLITDNHSGNGDVDQSITIGAYREGTVSGVVTKSVYSTSGRTDLDVGCADTTVTRLAWAGHQLLVQCTGADDDPGELYLTDGKLQGTPRPVPDEKQSPYNYLTQVTSADATSGLAIQGEYCEIECADKQPPAERRAVRFDLATGKVLEVIATPAVGRYMSSVSGGSHGVLYVTSGQRADAVYVRFAGEKHGTRVEGLPAAEGTLVAQP